MRTFIENGEICDECGRKDTHTHTDIESVPLSPTELAAVGRRLMALHAQTWEDSIEWEDVPLLSEGHWQWMRSFLGVIANEASTRADQYDRDHDVDSRELIDRLQ